MTTAVISPADEALVMWLLRVRTSADDGIKVPNILREDLRFFTVTTTNTGLTKPHNKSQAHYPQCPKAPICF